MSAPRRVRFLTCQEIAAILGVSKMSVYRLTQSGELQAYRIGHTIRVKPADFEAYMRAASMSGES